MVCWTAAGGIDGLAVERAHVEAYVRDLRGRGYAPNTNCQRIATLSSFYRWALSHGQVPSKPVEGARRPRKPAESTANGLSRHELTGWVDAGERRGGSAYACACLLALNALRVGELCALNVEDLGESTWHHTITLRASTTKGRKAAVVALAPRTVQALRLALGERRSGPLLLKRHGRRMTPYNVAYLVTSLAVRSVSHAGSPRTACATRRSRSRSTRAWACVMSRTSRGTRTRRPRVPTTGRATSSTATRPTPSRNNLAGGS